MYRTQSENVPREFVQTNGSDFSDVLDFRTIRSAIPSDPTVRYQLFVV